MTDSPRRPELEDTATSVSTTSTNDDMTRVAPTSSTNIEHIDLAWSEETNA
jgi:hypothetical protein